MLKATAVVLLPPLVSRISPWATLQERFPVAVLLRLCVLSRPPPGGLVQQVVQLALPAVSPAQGCPSGQLDGPLRVSGLSPSS